MTLLTALICAGALLWATVLVLVFAACRSAAAADRRREGGTRHLWLVSSAPLTVRSSPSREARSEAGF
jgi:hypothetical protein